MDPQSSPASFRVRIREILMQSWDPIGVRDEPAAADEYDSYVAGVSLRVAGGATEEELAAHLMNIEVERMGLSDTSAARTHAFAAARELLATENAPSAEEAFRAMTVNERLIAAGRLGAIDATAARRDRDALIALLRRNGLLSTDAERGLDWILEDPDRHGYPPI